MNTFRAELHKALTLPGVWIGLSVPAVASVAVTVLNAEIVRRAVESGRTDMVADTSPFETGFVAAPILGVVGAVVVGVLVAGSEYTTDRAEAGGGRQISTTLTAMPRRTNVFVGKALVVVAIVVALAAVSIPGNLAVARALMGGAGTETVTAEAAWTRCAGAALYMVLMGLMACAVTVLARTTAVPLVILIANGSLVSFSLLLSNVTPLAFWLPDLAGRRLFGIGTVEGGLDAGPGAIVMAAWAVGLLAVAAVVFRRRDA